MLSARSVKSRLTRRFDPKPEYYLRDNFVNEDPRGCSGFIVFPLTQHILYINTEESGYNPLRDSILCRYVSALGNYSEGRNMFIPVEVFADKIYEMERAMYYNFGNARAYRSYLPQGAIDAVHPSVS